MPCFIKVSSGGSSEKTTLINLSCVRYIDKSYNGKTYFGFGGENSEIYTDEEYEDFIARLPQSITI